MSRLSPIPSTSSAPIPSTSSAPIPSTSFAPTPSTSSASSLSSSLSSSSPSLSPSTSFPSSSRQGQKRQVCKKSTAKPPPNPSNGPILGVRQRQASPRSSATTSASNSGSKRKNSLPNRLAPRDRIDRERTEMRRSNFNHQPSTSRPVQCGLGIGKGGIRLMAARLRRNDDAERLNSLRRTQYLRDCEHSIPLAQFHRLCRHLFNKEFQSLQPEGPRRFQLVVVSLLREASEAYLVRFFEHCTLLIAHGNRVTLMPKDIELAKKLQRQL